MKEDGSVGEEKEFSVFWILGWDSCNKRQINRKIYLLTRLPCVYVGDTQGKVNNPLKWLRI